MMTVSGIVVEPDNDGCPTMYDVGYSLCRMQRFGGHIKKAYTVLQHLFAAMKLAELMGYSTRIQLLALLHDAHECVTGDIPRPWKTKDMSRLQDELDQRIYLNLGIMPPNDIEKAIVKQIDDALLEIEIVSVDRDRSNVYAAGHPLDALRFSQWYADISSPDVGGRVYSREVQELLAKEAYVAV